MWSLLRSSRSVLRQTRRSWKHDRATHYAATLAYYSIFSIVPLVIAGIAMSNLLFHTIPLERYITTELQSFLGYQGAEIFLVLSSGTPESATIATLVSSVLALAGALGIVTQLQRALHFIIDETESPAVGLHVMLSSYFTSFLLVLLLGTVLGVSLMITVLLSTVSVWHYLNDALLFGTLTCIFALLFHLIPRRRLRWSSSIMGAVITAILFTIGRWLIGWYISYNNVISLYGVAGSLVALLIWIYYSAQLFLLGAELTKALDDHQ